MLYLPLRGRPAREDGHLMLMAFFSKVWGGRLESKSSLAVAVVASITAGGVEFFQQETHGFGGEVGGRA